MWKVLAYGATTGSLFIYAVDAPKDTRDSDVACYAYARHGISYRDGDVAEYLGPEFSVEWIDKEFDA